MGISIWKLNFTDQSMVRESNFTIPSYSWRIVYASKNDILYFLYKNSNTTGTFISYKNQTWSVSEFEIKIFYTRFYGFNIIDNQIYILYESGTNKNLRLDYIQIAELVETGGNYIFLQNQSKVITELKHPLDTFHLIKGNDNLKVIYQAQGDFAYSYSYYLYEEGFDYSQVFTYSFGVIGLSMLTIIPLFVQWRKEEILELFKRR